MGNAYVQGTAALVFFDAGNRLRRLYRQHRARLIIPVHDAFVFEAPMDGVAEVAELTESVLVRTVQEWFPELRPRTKANITHPECWNHEGHHDSVEQFIKIRCWSSDPADTCRGGCKRALERTVFPKGRLQPLARRALLGGLGPRACKGLCRGLSFGSAAPGGTDRGRGACHWLPGGGAFCLLVHPGALGQEGENFRLEDGRGAFGARREAPRASLWSEAKTARTAQPRLSRARGEPPAAGPRLARVLAGGAGVGASVSAHKTCNEFGACLANHCRIFWFVQVHSMDGHSGGCIGARRPAHGS